MAEEQANIEEILESCLEAVLSGEKTVEEAITSFPEAANELRPLVETAVWLSSHRPVVGPRPGFVAASRARLVEDIRRGANARTKRRPWWERLTPRLILQFSLVMIVLVCLVLGSSGIAYASQAALPGDRLYPVKTGLEGLELLVNLDTAGDIRLHAQFSQLRLAEIEELLKLGRYAGIRIASANYVAHLNQAIELLAQLSRTNPAQASILAVELKNMLHDQITVLLAWEAIAPPEVQSELQAAVIIAQTNLKEVEQEQKRLEQGAQPTPTRMGGTALGPVPTTPGRSPDTPVPLDPITATPGSPVRLASPTPSQTPAPPALTPTSTPRGTARGTPSATLAPNISPTHTPTPTSTHPEVVPRSPTPTSTRTWTPTPTQGKSATLPPTTVRPTNTPMPSATATRQAPSPTFTPLPPTPTTALPPTSPPPYPPPPGVYPPPNPYP